MTAASKHTLALKPELRKELRNPLGLLIKGTPEDTMKQLKRIIDEEKPGYLVSVGDIVSQNMLKKGIQPHIIIVDGKAMRERTRPIDVQNIRSVTIKNPAGAITPQAWLAVEKALKEKRSTLIIIEGEEDLLTLVSVLTAPQGSIVVYGQPNEGIVAVKVDQTTKNKVNLIIQAMEPMPKS